jgi:hypothetical protein
MKGNTGHPWEKELEAGDELISRQLSLGQEMITELVEVFAVSMEGVFRKYADKGSIFIRSENDKHIFMADKPEGLDDILWEGITQFEKNIQEKQKDATTPIIARANKNLYHQYKIFTGNSPVNLNKLCNAALAGFNHDLKNW